MIVIAAGVPTVSPERVDPSTWPTAFSILGAGMLIFVAYEGFELIANASAEIKNPEKTLPKAFALAVGLVVALYVLIAFVVVGSLSPSQIADSADFALAQAASTSLGHSGFILVSISAVLATFSAINATLYGSAQLYHSHRRRTPCCSGDTNLESADRSSYHCPDRTGYGSCFAGGEYLFLKRKRKPFTGRLTETGD